MKVLFVDISMRGHHNVYLSALTEKVESVLIAPLENSGIKNVETFYCSDYDGKNKSIFKYILWIGFIRKVAIKEKPDVIHILYGDVLYRYFGIGLVLLRKWKVLVTFHGIRKSKLHDISIRRIFLSIDKGVVHTTSLVHDLNALGIHNHVQIEYPCFSLPPKHDKEIYREMLGIPKNAKVLACVGGIRSDKGIDILLEALNYVKNDFYLIIAGKPQDFDEAYIKESIAAYQEKVKCILRFLSDEEFTDIVNCSDAVVLPYRKIFNGASGPLVEAAMLEKYIIGPSHGSLYDIVERHQLGCTFETEQTESLARVIDDFLVKNMELSQKAQTYALKLNVATFIKEYFKIYDDIVSYTRR